jgi:hypothetical protein
VSEANGVSRHERKEAEVVRINVSKKTLVFALVVALLMIPAAAFAGSLFGDVDDGNTHFPGIKYMKDTGITVGCGDGTNYCPDQPVTRAQMGTFLYRMSGNDPATAPNVNADKLDGKDSSAFETSAFSTFHDAAVSLNGSGTVLDLDVPAGSYVIIAKARFQHFNGLDTQIHCKIQAGADFDESQTAVPNVSGANTGAMALMVVHSFASAGTAVLSCDDPQYNSTFSVYDSKITAIAVDDLSNVGG